MKKLVLGLVTVAVALAFTMNAYSAEVEEKTTVKTKGDTTVEKTEVKSKDVKAEQKVTTTPESTTTEEKVKTKDAKIEEKRVDTAKGSAGQTKVDVKKGALKKLNIEWAYYKQGTEYIIEYNVKDKADKDLQKELGLTDDQTKMLQAGVHKIVSTSPYTASDVEANFRSIIIKNLASSVKK